MNDGKWTEEMIREKMKQDPNLEGPGGKKTPEELLRILKAAAMGDQVFEHILGFIKVGMSEWDIAQEIDRTFEKLGSGPLAFPTIVAVGAHGADPHAEPSKDILVQEGDFITMDIGGTVGGYCGDMTRTVAMGFVSSEMVEVYQTVLDAQLEGIRALQVGASCREVDRKVRDIIAAAGYGDYYIHGTGHGVGSKVHESPHLNTRTEELLEADTAVTVEPGIYLPGRFGVRIEDLLIVTDFGIINAVKSEKELIVL